MISSGAVKATAPTMLDSKAQGKLDASKKAKDDFASNCADTQVSAHKGAVSLFERYAKSGENGELNKWARTTLPTLKHHFEMAQNPEKKH